MDEGRFPSGRAVDEADDPVRAMEEERRLGYVAWTRARRTLTLSYDPAAPSPFLLEAFSPAELGLSDRLAVQLPDEPVDGVEERLGQLGRQGVPDRVLRAVGRPGAHGGRRAGPRSSSSRRRSGMRLEERRPSASAPRSRAPASSRSACPRGRQGQVVDGRALVPGRDRSAVAGVEARSGIRGRRPPSVARRRPAARAGAGAGACAPSR